MSKILFAFSRGMSVEPFQTIGDCIAGAPISANCSSFINSQYQAIQTNAVQFKNATFSSAMTNASQDFDSVVAAAGLLARTQEAANISTNQASQEQRTRNVMEHDKDISKRQFQINEYHYNNKLEFLFFLQLLFISVLVMAILVYLNRNGSLTTQMTAIATMVLALIVILVGVSRYFYTRRTRDRHLWNRRYFASETAPGPDLLPSTCGPSAVTTINLDALIDPRTTQCAIETSNAFKELQKSAEVEVQNQLQGGSASSLWASSLSLGPSTSCKKA